MASFVGEGTLAFWQLLRGRALVRRRDFWLAVQQAGADALPIVTLISVLVGMILAFVGALAARACSAPRSTSPTSSRIGMVREMGAMMAALIMAGRTGAAYAAELGTMQVNEEIDALRTLGISPDRVPGPAAHAGARADDAAARALRRSARHPRRCGRRGRHARHHRRSPTTSRACSSSACTTSRSASGQGASCSASWSALAGCLRGIRSRPRRGGRRRGDDLRGGHRHRRRDRRRLSRST